MPDPITPTPIPPGTTLYSFNTSGVSPASGVSGVYAGPWAIETQELNIEYIRVPVHTGAPENTTLSLSADKVMTHPVHATKLSYKITASYKMEKSYDSFSTSSFTQPQQFEINADSTDVIGNTYTGLTVGEDMGAAGTIKTVQPYYRRVPWSDTLHTEVSQTAVCSNIGRYRGARINAAGGAVIEAEPNDVDNAWSYMPMLPGKNQPGAFFCSMDWGIDFTGPDYNIPGQYSPTKESINSVRNFINAVGDTLSSQGFFAQIPSMNSVGTNSIATRPVADTGVSNYDKSRHTF